MSGRKLALGVLAAIGGGGYAYNHFSSPPSSSTSSKRTTPTPSPESTSDLSSVRAHEAPKTAREYHDDHPKPVEDRHGNSVVKHSIAAEKNEKLVRKGKFSGREFDNHEQKHSGDPCRDFESVEQGRGKKGL
ncbi:hypothetical protein BJ878DRAFT_229777 [Calycina marina]|uniref:Uncharacterized protein n=1 Tax=Calycina marina TaxID=1763456 RepID=A0A9P7Z840_9HELO|nr:hypothetical protein BJ878DRAFT_229777 [Calycina marina]